MDRRTFFAALAAVVVAPKPIRQREKGVRLITVKPSDVVPDIMSAATGIYPRFSKKYKRMFKSYNKPMGG